MIFCSSLEKTLVLSQRSINDSKSVQLISNGKFIAICYKYFSNLLSSNLLIQQNKYLRILMANEPHVTEMKVGNFSSCPFCKKET